MSRGTRPPSDAGTILGGVVGILALLVGLGAWLHPFTPAQDSAPTSPVVTTTTPVPATTTAPVTTAPTTTGVPAGATPTDCATIADFGARLDCVSRQRNDAARSAIEGFN
jgi:hypothetical protein